MRCAPSQAISVEQRAHIDLVFRLVASHRQHGCRLLPAACDGAPDSWATDGPTRPRSVRKQVIAVRTAAALEARVAQLLHRSGRGDAHARIGTASRLRATTADRSRCRAPATPRRRAVPRSASPAFGSASSPTNPSGSDTIAAASARSPPSP